MDHLFKTDEYKVRRNKLELIRRAGASPFPSWGERTHTCAAIRKNFKKLSAKNTVVTAAGRIRSIRAHGGATFLHLEDATDTFQILLKKDVVGEAQYTLFLTAIDVGDFAAFSGTLFTTKRGEDTLEAHGWLLLTKALLPLPEKWHGLKDVEVRYRKRYLDLIANREVRRVFEVRSSVVAYIRDFLHARDFIEVETPIVQTIPGGANARPFITHHNALNIDLYLRVAPELYLKRLLVGNFERVFEVARCFRNEGLDWAHNPEFTQVELYEAYTTYKELMQMVEELFTGLVIKLHGAARFTYQGHVIAVKPPFPRVTFREALKTHAHIDIHEYQTDKELYRVAKKMGVAVGPHEGRGKIYDELFKTFVRPKIVQPTFIIDHPVALSPLAKQHARDPQYVERMQLVLGEGIELCNGFSELNDPLEQEKRFSLQEKLRAKGDEEAQRMDRDFIEALSYGMPPAAGLGIGIDRLIALLLDKRSIKEVILFPILRPEDDR